MKLRQKKDILDHMILLVGHNSSTSRIIDRCPWPETIGKTYEVSKYVFEWTGEEDYNFAKIQKYVGIDCRQISGFTSIRIR
jgi:hypothetical protein